MAVRGRILGLAILLAALVPLGSSLPAVDPVVTYLDAAGHFELGLPVVGVDELPNGGGPLNHRRVSFTADDCHRDLRIRILYEPADKTVGSGGSGVTLFYQFEATLSNATGQPLANGSLNWNIPGTQSYLLTDPGLVYVDLYLRRGHDVNYTLNVVGWSDLAAECSWQSLLLINELEQNPAGTDAGNEWVELYNNGFETVDLAGWTLQTHHGQVETHVFPAGTTLATSAYLVVTFPEQFLDNDSESVSLFGPRGWEVDRTPVSNDTSNDTNSWQRVPNASETWAFQASTQNATND